MDIRKTRNCQKCKNAVPLDQVRLYARDNENSIVLCERCCEELKRKTSLNPKLDSKVSDLPPPEYGSNYCSRCNYSFRYDKSKAGVTFNMSCPYCGKVDRLKFS